MPETVRLYDVTTRDYPNQRGDIFRSLQIFKCWVCGVLSNRVIVGWHSPGYGVRVVCPNSSECWHHELEKRVELLYKPHPQSYKDKLQSEIDAIKQKHLAGAKNDLEGNPDMTLPRRWVTHTFSQGLKSFCKHDF